MNERRVRLCLAISALLTAVLLLAPGCSPGPTGVVGPPVGMTEGSLPTATASFASSPQDTPTVQPTLTPAVPSPVQPPASLGIILYESGTILERAIWAMKGDGTDQHVVVARDEAVDGIAGFPRWSPDGMYFAYRWNYEDDGTRRDILWVADRDGQNRRQVSGPSRGVWYRWRDARTLFFSADAPAPGTVQTPMPPGERNFVYDLVTGQTTARDFPDGYEGYEKFVCSPGCLRAAGIRRGDRKYFIVDLRSGREVTVFEIPEGEVNGEVGSGVWSPDGKRLAFAHCYWRQEKYESFCDLYTVGSDGQDLRRLTDFEGGYRGRGSMTTLGRLAWSPDTRWLAFTLGVVGESLSFLGIIPADGGAVVNLGIAWRGGAEPVWSPDSRRIAFVSNAEFSEGRFADPYEELGQWDIYTVDIYTGEIRRLTNDPTMEMHIDWK